MTFETEERTDIEIKGSGSSVLQGLFPQPIQPSIKAAEPIVVYNNSSPYDELPDNIPVTGEGKPAPRRSITTLQFSAGTANVYNLVRGTGYIHSYD